MEYKQNQKDCPACLGSGYDCKEHPKCWGCDGTGVVLNIPSLIGDPENRKPSVGKNVRWA